MRCVCRAWLGCCMVLGLSVVAPGDARSEESGAYTEPYAVCDYEYNYGEAPEAVAWETNRADATTASDERQNPPGMARHMVAYYDDPLPGMIEETAELEEWSLVDDSSYGDAYEADGPWWENALLGTVDDAASENGQSLVGEPNRNNHASENAHHAWRNVLAGALNEQASRLGHWFDAESPVMWPGAVGRLSVVTAILAVHRWVTDHGQENLAAGLRLADEMEVEPSTPPATEETWSEPVAAHPIQSDALGHGGWAMRWCLAGLEPPK